LAEDGEEMSRLVAMTAENPKMSDACFIRNTPDRGRHTRIKLFDPKFSHSTGE
jgi:hypothetical protein